MKRWKRLSIALGLLLVLSFMLSGMLVAAAPGDNPGNGPPEFVRGVSITYVQGKAPPKTPPAPSGSEEEGYIFSGYYWSSGNVRYFVNADLNGSPVPESFINGIKASFQTWEDDPGSSMNFTYAGTTTAGISSWDGYMDHKNVVGWLDLGDPGIIAITIYWYSPMTLQVYEVDVAMNSDTSLVVAECSW